MGREKTIEGKIKFNFFGPNFSMQTLLKLQIIKIRFEKEDC